jgi:16S rRNA (cytosine1402-N4)-methyltransferase
MSQPLSSGVSRHVTVLREESLEYLAIRPEGRYVDCTAGGGGHSEAIAERLTTGRLLALDRDPAALSLTAQRLERFTSGSEPTVMVRQAAFSGLAAVVGELSEFRGGIVDGILADLGLSQMQLDDSARGFSFAADGQLDMRMDPAQSLTAAEVVNHADERELARVIYEFAEERRSRRIANAIVRNRPLHTARQLADVVERAVSAPRNSRLRSGKRFWSQRRIHPATLTFQALRIFVNNELGEVESLLAQLPALTRPGARVVIIAFHSGEDRIVKNTFRRWQAEGLFRVLTKHVVPPSDAETAANPRARSARLRCAERI